MRHVLLPDDPARRADGPPLVPVLLALLALLAAGLLLGGCATTGVNRGDVNLVSLEEEWQMGHELAREIDRQMPVIDDPALTGYISRIGRRIAQQTAMAERPWTFHVVADPSINAFNIPGGHVYVHTGLIEAAGSTAELAGVMAHEVAHGVARHGTEQLTKAQGLNLGAALLLGRDPSTLERLAAQVAGTGAMARFSRDDEREADRLGVRYLYEAGYNPAGMAAMFEKLLAERQRRPGAVAQFFSTHPLTEDRIRDVRRYANQFPDRRGLITTDGEFTRMQQRAGRY